jgi:hypothetical protein
MAGLFYCLRNHGLFDTMRCVLCAALQKNRCPNESSNNARLINNPCRAGICLFFFFWLWW